eukprot:7900173-Ditylum_brightwellii.AAC.1
MSLTPQDNLEELGGIDVTEDKRTKFCVSNWTSYTNRKARMANTGDAGQIFARHYKDLTTEDITTIFGAFTLDGINPSPQIQHKMNSQMVDKVQGNDFIASNITSNAELKYTWKKVCLLAEDVSADEQMVAMQGWSDYKVQCNKHKRIGDGLQAECIADDGYTWDFYLRNEPVPKKWTDMGLFAMHAHLLHMF